MNIHIGDIVHTIHIPILVKVVGYLGGSLALAISTTNTFKLPDWYLTDWFKWGFVICIYSFTLYRAIKNRNKR